MTTADLERMAADTPCSDARNGALSWAAGRIRELERALKIRANQEHCPDCGSILGFYDHFHDCKHYAIEQAVRNE